MEENHGTDLAIHVEGLSKRFGRVLALDNIDLSVETGEVFALLGPNGAGKSTLIDILCTIARPDSGKATVAGYDVIQYPRKIRKKIGVVFQDSTLDTRLTVLENLEFHGLVYQMRRSERRRRITEMLELLELTEWHKAVVRTLSSGMKRRLEIARALMHMPKILFLDEPTIGLDTQTRARIWDYLARLREDNDLTIIVTTHYIEEVENCDHACIIDHGRILANGTPGDLRSRYGAAMIRATPTNAEAAERIRSHYDNVVDGAEGKLLIPLSETGGADRLFAEFGQELSQIEVDQPSLESVFLSLTGRDLRDAGPPGRSKGKRNG